MLLLSFFLARPEGRATEFHEIIYNLSFIQNIGNLWVVFVLTALIDFKK